MVSRSRLIYRATSRLTFALAAITITAAPSYASPACEKLAVTPFPGITITSATSIPAGPFLRPTGGARATTIEAPLFCRVAAVVGTEVRFELWMRFA